MFVSSSLSGSTALCNEARRINSCLVLAVLVDVMGVFKPRIHGRTFKNDIADVTGLPHIPVDAR